MKNRLPETLYAIIMALVIYATYYHVTHYERVTIDDGKGHKYNLYIKKD